MPDPIRKISLSRWAVRLLEARPELARALEQPRRVERAEIERALAGARGDDEAALQRRLRRLRQDVLLRVMARDLAGAADLAEVCATMSALADASIACALGWAEAACGAPRGRLIVVAMGKLGGGELNVSSDVDLVFVHDADAAAQPALERTGRRLIRLLDEPTGDGRAFRVDMRLRPWGDSGPLVAGLDALEAYFVTQGREWERYAWIKARALSGNAAALEALVRPFVYRKYLDYGTLAAMRRLHAEVRREVARRELAGHVKLGPGGIREIEFVAQALQLARGGRDPELAVRPTLEALARLGDKRQLPGDAVRELSQAYAFLRNTEHRLQYLDDAQTHELPHDADDRDRVARMSGCEDWGAFAAQLEAHRAAVTRHFQAVFEAPEEAGEARFDGYRDPAAAAARLEALHASARWRELPEESRTRFEALAPALARAAAALPGPDATFARGLDLIEAVARRAAYLALLAEHPEALGRVARIVGASSWAAEYLTRHPLLLDELLDDRVLYAPPDWAAFDAQLGRALAAAAADPERQMDALREAHHAQLFRLLAQDLAGLLSVEALADQLSALADRVLEAALRLGWAQLRGRHRDGAAQFAVVAYGKLGGKELGYASDLDLIFVYDDAREGAAETYARLAQRFNNWLTTRTSAGVLFETDLRLRPSGEAGLLVSSLEAFERYQEKDAWVWEHQALTRARFCAGDARIGAAFEAIRARILRRRRDPAALAREVLAMREKMHAAHPNKSGLFDVKHDPGGMVDLEFVVQYLVLAHSHRHAGLVGNLGNIALLGLAGGLGLIPSELAEKCQDAYRAFRRTQHALRLQGAKYARVEPADLRAEAEAVKRLWREVFGA